MDDDDPQLSSQPPPPRRPRSSPTRVAGVCVALGRALILLGWVLLCYALYFYNYGAFCSWKYEDSFARFALVGDPQLEGYNRLSLGYYGVIDLLINDYFMNHIIHNIVYYVKPTHMIVMGDLLGSQNIGDSEFAWRAERYHWIFRHAMNNSNVSLINLVGNHDIGYGNQVDDYLIKRFEREFGKTNTHVWISTKEEAEGPPAARRQRHLLGIVNGQLIDRSRDQRLRGQTWSHMERLRKLAERENATLLLATHIPLHKDDHVCVDVPMVQLTDGSTDVLLSGGATVRWQNTLSANATAYILDSLKPKFIFVGHDHEGCIYDHPTARGERTREYTLRSMMGDYGGYIGLFEIRQREAKGSKGEKQYDYHFQYCPYLWIKLHIALCVAVLVWVVLALLFAIGGSVCKFYLKCL